MFGAVKRCASAVVGALVAVSAWSAGLTCGPELTVRIPPRDTGAPGGREFIASVEHVAPEEREAAVVAQVLSGNIPRFLRALAPVVLSGALDRSGTRVASATLCVMPDYLAIGSDHDFVRMPMNLRSATMIARNLGFILPTGKIVDAIHEQAAYRLIPEPMEPGPQMVSPDYFLEHEYRIRAQELRDGVPMGALVAGHKKDIVLSNLLDQRRGRVAIYGWQYPDGTPIQPLSTAHHAGYADYSHGVRLVSEIATVDGQRSTTYDILADDRRASLLSAEGAIPNVRSLMADPSFQSSVSGPHATPSAAPYSPTSSVLQQRKPK